MKTLLQINVVINKGSTGRIAEEIGQRAITAGCPIIVNYTSDISEYVKNETNGIVIADFTKDAVKKALEKATSIDGSCIKKMKSNATLLAENKFDYRSYEEGMFEFLNK